MKTYLIVFIGKWENNRIVDIGNDPCFADIPSWGICRPNVRKYIEVGYTLIFLAKIGSQYFLKGWFVVGEKLDYISAKKRFPLRENVIISDTSISYKKEWKNKGLKKFYLEIYGNTLPEFLLNIKSDGNLFFQNPVDNHEIDNWKCGRIYNCKITLLKNCILNNECFKKDHSLMENKYKNYIVADENKWDDVDNLKITIDDIVRETGFSKSIKTPTNQHNVIRFDDYKDTLLKYIEERKSAVNNN